MNGILFTLSACSSIIFVDFMVTLISFVPARMLDLSISILCSTNAFLVVPISLSLKVIVE